MAKVTLQSIADRVGVSRMTVSNAFSRPDQLSADLRARILAAADELGYVGPDPAARALARGRTGVVGLLINGSLSEAFEDAVSAEFLASVADALADHGLALTLLPASSRRAASCPLATSRSTARWSTSASPTRPTSPGWTGAACPMVVVDHNVRERRRLASTSTTAAAPAPRPSTWSTSATAAIGILTLETGTPDGRLNYPAARADARLARRPRPGRHRADGRHHAVPARATPPRRPRATLLDRPDRPTAVVCFSDAFALGDDPGRRVARPVGARRRLGRRLRRQPRSPPSPARR